MVSSGEFIVDTAKIEVAMRWPKLTTVTKVRSSRNLSKDSYVIFPRSLQHYEHGEQCKHTLTKEPRVLGRADGMTQTVHTSAMFTKQGKFKMK